MLLRFLCNFVRSECDLQFLNVPQICACPHGVHQTAQPVQKATELGQGAHALPRSPMIHTEWFRQGQPRSRAAAQKLVDRIYAFNPRSWIPGCAVAHGLFVRPFAGTDHSPLLDV
jgi:hypothetical protein